MHGTKNMNSLMCYQLSACFQRYAMDQVVSRRPLTVENRVRSEACQCEISGGKGSTVTGYSQRASVLLVIIIPLRFFRAFSSVVRQMPGYNSQRRGTARTFPILILLFCLLFGCKCVLYYCHRVSNPIAVNKYIYIYQY